MSEKTPLSGLKPLEDSSKKPQRLVFPPPFGAPQGLEEHLSRASLLPRWKVKPTMRTALLNLARLRDSAGSSPATVRACHDENASSSDSLRWCG